MSNITEEIEKLAEDYADNHAFRVPFDGTNNFYDDKDFKWSKEGFIAGYKAALQNKVSDINAEGIINTIYKRHNIDLKNPHFDIAIVNEMIYDTLKVVKQTEQSKQYTKWDMWQSFISGRKFQQGGKYSPEQPERDEPDFDNWLEKNYPVIPQNKVSDVSAEEYINKKQLQFNPYTNEGVITKVELTKYLEEYASIVNEREDIDEECLKITGHNSPKEYAAYEKGREDEQEVIMKWIEEWNGSSNSVMGALLKKKFNELFTYLSKQTNSHKLKNKTEW